MKNYFKESYNRYEKLKKKLKKEVGAMSDDDLNLKLGLAIDYHNQLLTNLIMSGLGMGTLYLRMGAIIMIAEELAKPDNEKNISFLKVIADNLVSKLPNDGEWTNIWVKYLELNPHKVWNDYANKNKENQTKSKFTFKINDFVEFRNNVAHQKITIDNKYSDKIKVGLNILRVMSDFKEIFINCRFEENTKLIFFSKKLGKPINVWPYIRVDEENKKEAIGKQPFQANVEGILPYLFSGKYYQGAKFINTQGGETNKEQDEDIEVNFKEIQKVITNFNGDKAFNFDEKTSNYNEWFIGREDEVKAISDWIDNSETEKNVFPIFAPAGLGKGALVAKVIENLKEKNIKHLFHYCGSGAANNLQAILYHLIIQGKGYKIKDPVSDKEDTIVVWKSENLSEKFKGKYNRFPTQYIDVIELFQALLDSTEPEIEMVKEITDKDFDEALSIRNKQGELNINVQFKNICDLLYKISANKLHKRTSELLERLELLLSDKTNLNLKEKNYDRLIEISINLNKDNFKNNLLSYIPKDYSQVSNTDNKIKKEVNSKLVIIIDGLDEAAVADHSKRISDWFYKYNDDAPNADDIRSKRADKWISPKHIKWIFTFRYTKDESKKIKQYDYPNEIEAEFNIEENESLQPLKPLNITAEELNKALIIDLEKNMNKNAPTLTNDFINAILEKGKIKDDKAESSLK